ncbi:glycosyltransferase [Capnocytophaga canimorsus]|uniref:glycosyltransferase n=1 Tax=Capnocytophaga canimorsus TaxID=28188 RepID=UPI00384E0AB4
MILIDALHINNGGGKVLLDYLVDKLEKTNLELFYLFDDRIKKTYNVKQSNQAVYMNSSIIKRYNFYIKYKNRFAKILVLGNIPPLVNTNAEVYTYFHNSVYLNVPNDFSFIEGIKYRLKVSIIKWMSPNTNYWLVQSETVKEQFINKFRQSNKVKVLPFFPKLERTQGVKRVKSTFLYVSNATPHKNHHRLIEAFCRAYDKLQRGKLIVTVAEQYSDLLKRLKSIQDEGYPIENIGFVNRLTLARKYQESEYIIFPSLAESFGLGLVEGISMGCKVIGANLPYTFAVCEPSLVFEPTNILDIENAILLAMEKELPLSKAKVYNGVDTLIKFIRE